jgi:N-acetylglucosaminyldiphosphoundecaprenol N-acetyl-beta-D-mannosaminyltransferase
MIDRGKKNLLGVLIDAVDYEAAASKVLAAARNREGFAATALAVHGVMTAHLRRAFRYQVNHMDLVVPDGQPVRWGLNLLYKTALSDRVYGPELMLRLCDRAAQEGLAIYLLGSRAEVVEQLVAHLKERFPRLIVAGASASDFRPATPDEKAQAVAAIQESDACMTFVGLGCPRQEKWAYDYHRQLSMPVIAVGAAFDIHAGFLPQASPTLQNSGLEWLYRLAQEPARLWKRYLLLNPYYLWLLFLQLTGLKKFNPANASPPEEHTFV